MRKFIILGVAKNIENQITILGDCLKAILDQRDGSKAYIYEDNSTDKTAERLEALAKSDERIIVRCERDSIKTDTEAKTWDNKPCRMERIALARNKVMEMWEKDDKEDTIVIWLDTDRVHRLDGTILNQVAQQLEGTPIEVAAGFFAYSVNHRGEMYDTYAYRSEKNALGPEIMGEAWWSQENQNKIRREVADNPLPTLQVVSACNGLAMYKSEAIRGLRFSAMPTEFIEKYYRVIWRDQKHSCSKMLQDLQENVKTHHDGVCLGRYCFGTEGMWYKNNSGYNQPIVCEWLSFHLGIRERGYKGLFIVKPWMDISGH